MSGRSRISNVDFFRHPTDLHDDRRIKALRVKYGLEGYALYNLFLESLAGANNLELEVDDVELELLAGDYGTDKNSLSQILEEMVRLRLIQQNGNLYFSDYLNESLSTVFKKRDYERERYSEREKAQKKPLCEDKPKEPISAAELIQTKLNKTKQKEIYKEILDEAQFPFLREADFQKVFQAYREMRQAKKAVFTLQAEKILLSKLHKFSLSEACQLLEESIEHGWTGVVFPKNSPSSTPGSFPVSREVNGRLHDGTKVKKIKGEWRDFDNPFTINLQPSYYPEITNDTVMSEQQWLEKQKTIS